MNNQNNFNDLNNQSGLNNNELSQGPITLNNLTTSEPEMLNSEVNEISQNSSNNMDLNQSTTNNNFETNNSMGQNNISFFNPQTSQFSNEIPKTEPNNLETLQSNSSEVNLNVSEPKDKKKLIKLIIIIVSLIAIVTVGILVVSKLLKPEDKGSEIISTSFFVRNDDGMSAIFTEDGKQLTDFIYDVDLDVDFINHAIHAKNDKGEVGVINDAGKTVIEFGKYKTIKRVGGMYEATDEDLNVTLFDAKGKKIVDLDLLSIKKSGDLYLVLLDGENYKLINYKGNTLLEFKKQGEEYIIVNEVIREDEKITLYYNGNNYLIDLVEGKVITEFKSDEAYCVENKKQGSKNSYIMGSCDYNYDSSDDTPYKIIKNGKYLKDISRSTCPKLFFVGNMDYKEDNYIYCGDTYNNKFMDDEGNILVESDNEIAFIDKDNYALLDLSDKYNPKVQIYKNGNIVKELENTLTGTSGFSLGYNTYSEYLYPLAKHYILYTYEKDEEGWKTNGGLRLYNTNGELVNDKYYKYIDDYSKNGYAIVSEESDEYYVIDDKGEKISDNFYRINSFNNNDYYEIKDIDGKISYFDNKLNIIIEDLEEVGSVEKNDLKVFKKDEKYIIFSIKELKVIFESEYYIELDTDYFKVYNDDNWSYYSYKTLKEFYSKK